MIINKSETKDLMCLTESCRTKLEDMMSSVTYLLPFLVHHCYMLYWVSKLIKLVILSSIEIDVL